MTDLYLIAHKVRGEPAFDIATNMICPECNDGEDCEGCPECDGTGLWWIIPTSGHRAYPIMNWPLNALCHNDGKDYDWSLDVITESGPLAKHPKFASLPDHYPERSAPSRDLASLLGILDRPLAPIKRRL